MSKNIVVITGSPRKNGNCDRLAAAFIEGAESAGHQVTRFDAGRMTINPCKDCKYCFKHEGVCVQDDAMQEIHAALRTAEVLVMASPVYWYDISAQLKLAIDRMYCMAAKPYPIQAVALLLCCADTTESSAGGAIASYKLINDYVKWQDLGVVVTTGVSDKGDIDGHEALEKARELGKSIS